MVLLVLLAVVLVFFYLVGMPIWLLALNSRVAQLETSLKKKETPAASTPEPIEVSAPQETSQPKPTPEEQSALPAQEPVQETPVMAAAVSSARAEEPAKQAQEIPAEEVMPTQNKPAEEPEPVLRTQDVPEQPGRRPKNRAAEICQKTFVVCGIILLGGRSHLALRGNLGD